MKTMLIKIASLSALVMLSLPFTAHASDSQYIPGFKRIKGSVLPPSDVYYRGYQGNYSADENEALLDNGEVYMVVLINQVV